MAGLTARYVCVVLQLERLQLVEYVVFRVVTSAHTDCCACERMMIFLEMMRVLSCLGIMEDVDEGNEGC